MTDIKDLLAAETERWQNRDRQRLEQIDRLQATVQSAQSASAERPAPPQRHLTGGEREVLHKALVASSTLVHPGGAAPTNATQQQAAPERKDFLPHNQCPSCYWHPGHEPAEWFAEEAKIRGYSAPTERAAPHGDDFNFALHFMNDETTEHELYLDEFQVALYPEDRRISISLTGEQLNEVRGLPSMQNRIIVTPPPAAVGDYTERARSVAYQAGVRDTLARLQEPDVREAVSAAVGDYIFQGPGEQPMELQLRAMDCANAAIARLVEVLK